MNEQIENEITESCRHISEEKYLQLKKSLNRRLRIHIISDTFWSVASSLWIILLCILFVALVPAFIDIVCDFTLRIFGWIRGVVSSFEDLSWTIRIIIFIIGGLLLFGYIRWRQNKSMNTKDK